MAEASHQRKVCGCAAAKLPSNQLVASRMTACVVLAAETAAIVGYLLYVAPLMPDCVPQTVVLCTLVLVSYYLHYRCLCPLLLFLQLHCRCLSPLLLFLQLPTRLYSVCRQCLALHCLLKWTMSAAVDSGGHCLPWFDALMLVQAADVKDMMSYMDRGTAGMCSSN